MLYSPEQQNVRIQRFRCFSINASLNFWALFYTFFQCWTMVYTETIVFPVGFSLASIIATFAICGCPTTSPRIIVLRAGFVGWAVEIIFDIAMIVACASTYNCSMITIANPENTWAIVRFVKKISSVPASPRTKCRADTPYIGIASNNWPRTIRDVRFARKHAKHPNRCKVCINFVVVFSFVISSFFFDNLTDWRFFLPFV